MIQIRSLSFQYAKNSLFRDMDLELRAGAIHGLLGLNAAGKTSLLKLIAGALFPSSGQIEVFGRNPAKRAAVHLSDRVGEGHAV